MAAHSRSHGHSAAAKVAYVTASRGRDVWVGKTHDYSRKKGVTRSACVNYEGTPKELARLMDTTETRRNSTVCRELIFALPHGLPEEQRWELAFRLGETVATRYGVAGVVALHEPSAKGDRRNDHAHIVFSTRKIEDGELTTKTRVLDDRKTGAGEVKWLRAESARLIGEALAEVGRTLEIPAWDHRSYADRGIDQPTTRHEGVRGRALARKGRATVFSRDNQVIRSALEETRKLESEIVNEYVNNIIAARRPTKGKPRAERHIEELAREPSKARGGQPVRESGTMALPLHGHSEDQSKRAGPPGHTQRNRGLRRGLGARLGKLGLSALSKGARELGLTPDTF